MASSRDGRPQRRHPRLEGVALGDQLVNTRVSGFLAREVRGL